MNKALIKEIENTLLKLNTISSFTPPLLDSPDTKKYGKRANLHSSLFEKYLTKLKQLTKKVENEGKWKNKTFLLNQLSSLIYFLENYNELKLKEGLNNIFGVQPISNISSLIKKSEKIISKKLESLNLSYEEWENSSLLKFSTEFEFKLYCKLIIESLKSLTLERFRIKRFSFQPLQILTTSDNVNYYFFSNKPKLLMKFTPTKNLYLLVKSLAHETFPGHHFIESIRRKLFKKTLLKFNIIYSPLASFEEGMSEYLFELLFPYSDISTSLELAHQITKLRYMYCYRAVDIMFTKNMTSVESFFEKCKFLNNEERKLLLQFVKYNKIYAAIYTPSYFLIKKLHKKVFYNNIYKFIKRIVFELVDMELLRKKYIFK